MKTACIITVGNELLSGDSLDTNSQWLAERLTGLSIPVCCIFSVGDDIAVISKAIKSACELGDIVILTGGLGPTDDDLTRNGLADFLDENLVFNEGNWQGIKSYFVRKNYKIPEKNKVQAFYPESAEILSNNYGTACGIKIAREGKLIYALPGPPSEMKNMFTEHVEVEIENFNGGSAILSRKIHLIGIGESAVAEKLGELMKRNRNPLINCTVSRGVITLHIVAKAGDKKAAEKMAQNDIKKLKEILGDVIYGYDSQTLAEVVGEGLVKKHNSVSVAESCTGGLIAKMLTDIAGSSQYLTHGWVTYSNKAKSSQLGVDAEIIEKHGAVSEEVAKQMAIGAKIVSGSDYSIAVTGIAGPGGGNEQKPVGLVYIGLFDGKNCEVHKYNFSGTREFIRLRAAQTALNLLRLKNAV